MLKIYLGILLVIRNTNLLRYLAFHLTFGQPGFYTVQPKRLPVIYSITVAVTVSVQDSFYLLNLQVSLIYICYLPGGRSVWEKTVPEVLSTARGRRPRAVLKTKGTVFSHTDRPSPGNNIFIFFLQ